MLGDFVFGLQKPPAAPLRQLYTVALLVTLVATSILPVSYENMFRLHIEVAHTGNRNEFIHIGQSPILSRYSVGPLFVHLL
jgi:hypothetical protein